jgi:hypothetical protein
MLCNGQERWNFDVKVLLCQALHQTLIRLCINTENTTAEELYNIARDSISYPNNGAVAYAGGLGTNLLQTKIGKPHDIELRVALKLYHKFKQKRNRIVLQPSSEEDVDSPFVDSIRKSTNRAVEKPCHAACVMRIRSDMGVAREFTSERQFADLIVKTLEELIVDESLAIPLFKNHQRHRDNVGQQGRHLDDSWNESCNLREIVQDIRADKSGLIYITTNARVQQLRSIGRLPCSLCTKWCKGEKGLWWHQQQEHGKYHSDAIIEAKLQIDNFAIVPYYYSLGTSGGTVQFQTCSLGPGDKDLSVRKEQPLLLDYMEPVRAGDIQRVQLMIEVKHFDIDRLLFQVCEM